MLSLACPAAKGPGTGVTAGTEGGLWRGCPEDPSVFYSVRRKRRVIRSGLGAVLLKSSNDKEESPAVSEPRSGLLAHSVCHCVWGLIKLSFSFQKILDLRVAVRVERGSVSLYPAAPAAPCGRHHRQAWSAALTQGSQLCQPACAHASSARSLHVWSLCTHRPRLPAGLPPHFSHSGGS